MSPARSQPSFTGAPRGFILVVTLLLMLLISMVGILVVQGTAVQNRLANATYDRQIGFQNAEAALRAAAQAVVNQPNLVARDCQSGGVICLTNPFSDPNLPAGSIHTVSTGTATGDYTAGAVSTGQPQFVVENMGNWVQTQSDTGFNQTSNVHNYGVQGGSSTAVYYRITVRSGDPSIIGQRAVVMLQAVVRQG